MSKTNPKQEWGFYASTPRIVRTQYKQLSHTEKWLYVCLKDLCGDKGMCYRTLKALSQETDLSTGNLSTGIRHLHEAGLIHAEKKRRSANPTAKEVWHISIVDIWQANVECSKYERYEENVQNMNVNLQSLNEPPLERSENEQQRSYFVDRRITLKNNSNEERTSEEERVASATSARALSSQDTSSHQGDDDALADHALAAPPVQYADSSVGTRDPVHTRGDVRRDQIPETPTVSTQTTNHAEMERTVNEIPHPDTSHAPAEPVVPPEMPQAGTVGTGRVAAVPEREESAGHLRRTEISLAKGDEHAHQTDDHLSAVPALDADGLRGGVEAVAAAAAFQEPLAQKGDTDATSTLPDPDPVPAAAASRNHVHRVEDRRAPVQAEAPVTLLSQTPFPVTSPPNGAVGSGTGTSGPRASGRRGKAQQQDVTQALSLQGAQVKEWMETIKGRKRRMTPKNVQAWNALAEEDEMSFENLRDAIQKLENIKWVQDHDYVIDEHVLVQEDGNFTFAKGLELVKRGRKPKASSPSAEQFTSKTLDKERNDKRIQEMIEKSHMIRAAREAAQAQAIQ